MSNKQKSAFIAIVGKPNVGKSSLLNKLLGEKIAIVSAKPQTTRTRITGVLTKEDTQLIFIDTPGMHKPRTVLSEYMVRQVTGSIADVDLAVLIVEPGLGFNAAEKELIACLEQQKIPAIAVINKIDTVRSKDMLIPRMDELSKAYAFEEIVPVCALTGSGLDLLTDLFIAHADEGPHFFPDDALTDQPERVICAELIREKVLICMHDEIPHGIAVTIENMTERPDSPITDISAVIYCEKNSHKGMVIGKGGLMLKRIASMARVDIEAFLGQKVNLQFWVKVKEDWRNEERFIKNFGFN